MGLNDLSGCEPDEFFDAIGLAPLKEATVLHSELRHAADSLEEKVYRLRYYQEAPSLEWLSALSEDLCRMLRMAQEK